ncbi:2'-5' RNA ligase family protein [Streptomyces sp. R41]|uniref:2'-5' RNA ligase family protein n=1 Tax=Streptomyces sp. R41 TaxID=3238632 RepID=A0AB39R7I8_9ACTN
MAASHHAGDRLRRRGQGSGRPGNRAGGPRAARRRRPAFNIEIGSAVIDPEAILLRVHPDGPVRQIRDGIRSAIGDVLGEVPERAEGFPPHVSVAYSAGDGPAEPVAQALAGLDLTPARARISSAELIVLHRDHQMYEWESFATVPLG